MKKDKNDVIVQLSTAELELLPQFYHEWLETELATNPVNRTHMEKAIVEAYKTASVKAPKIAWEDSPLAGITAASKLGAKDSANAAITKELWAQPLDNVRTKVLEQVSPEVYKIVKAELMEKLAERAAAVCVPLTAELEQRATTSKAQGSEKAVRELLGYVVFGQFEAAWFSFYDYMDRVLQIKEAEQARGLFKSGAGGWYWPFKKSAIATEHPNKLLFDAQGRPHSPTETAIEYPDGFGVFCWHGVRVPQEVIVKPQTVDWALVEKTQDADLKNALAEIKALKWSKSDKEADNEKYGAALAVKRLGGVGALKDMITAHEGKE